MSRRMDEDSQLFRAVIVYHFPAESDQGERVELRYGGPFTTVGLARAAITRAKGQWERMQGWWGVNSSDGFSGYVEACTPAWERVG